MAPGCVGSGYDLQRGFFVFHCRYGTVMKFLAPVCYWSQRNIRRDELPRWRLWKASAAGSPSLSVLCVVAMPGSAAYNAFVEFLPDFSWVSDGKGVFPLFPRRRNRMDIDLVIIEAVLCPYGRE